MAWFHKKLMDLIAAFETRNWDAAAKILHEHDIDLKESKSKKANLELEEAGSALNRYTTRLTAIRRVIDQEHWGDMTPQNWPLDDHDRARLLGELKNAERDVREFERIIKKLVDEGKFLE